MSRDGFGKDRARPALHQLRLLEWMESAAEAGGDDDGDDGRSLLGEGDRRRLRELERGAAAAGGRRRRRTSRPSTAAGPSSVPEKWRLTKGVDLYPWQEEAVGRWLEHGRGTIKAVTGGGKTELCLAIAERLQNGKEPDLRLAVVVPTITLMEQWRDRILERGNLPAGAVARLGGGHKGSFGGGERVLIAVLASARKKLPGLVEEAKVGDRLLLAVDECHHAGSDENMKVFGAARAFSLGLSATPERGGDADEEGGAGYGGTPLGRELGPVIVEFHLSHAREHGVVPEYSIRHYGLPLSAKERGAYDRLSRQISDARKELQGRAPAGKTSGPEFFKWASNEAARKNSPDGLASQFLSDTSRRKEVLYAMESRRVAARTLLQREFGKNPDARVILFHERIREVMKLFLCFRDAGIEAVVEHSGLPRPLRNESIELFREGAAKVIVSARSLIEGFDVPAVDMAVITAASTSERQRIQSLGRVLRKHKDETGKEKDAVVHILYAKDTVDEEIYEKQEWDKITGEGRNGYFHWDGLGEEIRQSGPPKHPLPGEERIDEGLLREGEEYPGRYEGREYSCDANGNITDADGALVRDVGSLPESIFGAKGGYGRFRVTRRKRYVLALLRRESDWKVVFVTRLAEDLDPGPCGGGGAAVGDLEKWAETARPGDPYPETDVPLVCDKLKFKRKRGGVVARMVKRGLVYARMDGGAADRERGDDAKRIVDAVRRIEDDDPGVSVSSLALNEMKHVLFRARGRLVFVCALRKGLEFPDTDERR